MGQIKTPIKPPRQDLNLDLILRRDPFSPVELRGVNATLQYPMLLLSSFYQTQQPSLSHLQKVQEHLIVDFAQ